jgi:recombination protein RecA
VIFINQIRMKIGVMFGSPETTTGGNALKFYSSVRLDIRRIGAIKAADRVTGNRTRVKVVKNKLAAPFREHEFDIMYGTGISKVGDLLDLGTDVGIIDKSGSWYSYQGDRLGQGREQSSNFILGKPEVMKDIEERIRLHFGLVPEVKGEAQEPEQGKAPTKEDTAKTRGKSSGRRPVRGNTQN